MAKFFVKIALLLLIAGFVLVIVGQTTSYWLVRPGFHRGLWRYCYEGKTNTKETCNKLDDRRDFDKKLWATRIFTILTSVTSFGTVLLMICYLRCNDGRGNLRRIKGVIAFCIICAIFVFVGVGVYSSRKHADNLTNYHNGWSFILTIIAGVLHLLLIPPLLLEIRRASSLGAYESI